MSGNFEITSPLVALAITLATPALAQPFTPVSQMSQAGCYKLIELLSSGTGHYGDYSSNLRWENGQCRVTTTITRDCGGIARWLGLDPDLLDSGGNWSSVDPRCTHRYDQVEYRFDDPLGRAYLRYWNSKSTVWWYEYNFEAAGFDVYGGFAFGFMTKSVNSILEKADADALEQAGFSFSADGSSLFSRDAFIMEIEAASGTSSVYVDQVLQHYGEVPGHALTVAFAGAGAGTVTASPPGDIIGVASSHSFFNGTTVSLAAVPDLLSSFAGWSGDCAGSGPCILMMEADRVVTASFEPLPRGVTASGADVVVVPSDPAGGAPAVPMQLEFSSISSAGETTVTVTDTPPGETPTDYVVLSGGAAPQYIDISTTATFSGPVEIALQYDPAAMGITLAEESALRLLHYHCDAVGSCSWEDVTAPTSPNPDLERHVLYGVTTAFSVFAPALPIRLRPFTFVGFEPPIGGADASGGTFLDPVRAFKLNSTVPVKMTLTQQDQAVTGGTHTIRLVKFSNDTTSEPAIDVTPTDGATSGNVFRRSDGASGAWHFNLDTRPLSQGIWQINATLSDGTVHSAFIELK